MKFRLYREHGAQNSGPIFDAFEQGVKRLGHTTTHDSTGIPVIWSVLWHGRMSRNRLIYKQAIESNRPIVIIEVGNLLRGTTWRISLNQVNNQGYFGNDYDINPHRHHMLNVDLKPINSRRKPEILIAAQHERSLQWEGQPSMTKWAREIIERIRQYSDRPIVVRPHPRSPFSFSSPNVKVTTPQRVPNTYDDFNIDYGVHCVVNHNSGPGVQAAIAGTPIIVDNTSLAAPVSDVLANIETVQLPDRTEWFNRLCHTEWTRDEIAQGLPQARLISKIEP